MRIPTKLSVVACLSAVLVGLLACTSQTTARRKQERLVTNGLLLGEPCGPPCWQGLIPGVSTLDEVDETLRSSQYVAPGSVYTDRFGEMMLSVLWRPRWESPADNRFVLQSNVLQHMRMYVEPDVTLGQLVDKRGPPDKFQAGRSLHPEPVYIAVDLFYRELGMMVELRLSEDDRELRPGEEIFRVHYFEPAPLRDVLASLVWGKGAVLGDDQLQVLEHWLEGWHDWEGYGPVELTYHFGAD